MSKQHVPAARLALREASRCPGLESLKALAETLDLDTAWSAVKHIEALRHATPAGLNAALAARRAALMILDNSVPTGLTRARADAAAAANAVRCCGEAAYWAAYCRLHPANIEANRHAETAQQADAEQRRARAEAAALLP